MRRRLAPVLLALALSTAACKSAEEPPAAQAPDSSAAAAVFEAEGTIRHVALEGGFYGIEAEGGARYNPMNLDEAFRQDGLAVRFRARRRTDVVTIQQWGTPVEILEMTVR